MKFQIGAEIFEKFPGLNVGIVVVKGIDNRGKDEGVLEGIKDLCRDIRNEFDKGELSENPKIGAWRNAYSLFGAKSKKYKCSVENLYQMILDGIELCSINKIVDIYNFISIKHMIPVGGDDVDKVDGDIRLGFAKGDEPFIVLHSDEIKHPKEGEVVYVDDKEVLCRRWNWRECDKSKMTEETKNVVLVVEGLPPFSEAEVEGVLEELSSLVERCCGGESKRFVLNSSTHEVEF
ncbi:hypothetical protein CMO92_05130 [Candidatus Woesearchaeota archaeon]|nr:hypothetical protein [Candidatus Woesearchaeota archaeon]